MMIALTFDDGPNTTVPPDILDLLEKCQVHATFFLIGNNIREETEPVVRRALHQAHGRTPGEPGEYKNQVTSIIQ